MGNPLPDPRVLRFDLDPGFYWEDLDPVLRKVFSNRMPVAEFVDPDSGEVVVYVAKPPSEEELGKLAQRFLDKCRIKGSFEIE